MFHTQDYYVRKKIENDDIFKYLGVMLRNRCNSKKNKYKASNSSYRIDKLREDLEEQRN